MFEEKNRELALVQPIGILTLLLMLFQILSYFFPELNNATAFLQSVFLEYIAPFSFLLILLITYREISYREKLSKKLFLVVFSAIFLLILSLFMTMIVRKITGLAGSNPILKEAKNNFLKSLLVIGVQLFGEESIRLSMFFLLYKGFKYKYENRKKYWISWILTSLVFGLLHLSVYNYNFLHCILVIALPALYYGYLWKKTESPLILWATHFTYDLIIVGLGRLI